jgi:hypothetical protein
MFMLIMRRLTNPSMLIRRIFNEISSHPSGYGDFDDFMNVRYWEQCVGGFQRVHIYSTYFIYSNKS